MRLGVADFLTQYTGSDLRRAQEEVRTSADGLRLAAFLQLVLELLQLLLPLLDGLTQSRGLLFQTDDAGDHLQPHQLGLVVGQPRLIELQDELPRLVLAQGLILALGS